MHSIAYRAERPPEVRAQNEALAYLTLVCYFLKDIVICKTMVDRVACIMLFYTAIFYIPLFTFHKYRQNCCTTNYFGSFKSILRFLYYRVPHSSSLLLVLVSVCGEYISIYKSYGNYHIMFLSQNHRLESMNKRQTTTYVYGK